MARVQAKCTHCGTSYPIEPSLLGKRAKCNRCGNTFLLHRDANEASDSDVGTREVTTSASGSRPVRESVPRHSSAQQQRSKTARPSADRSDSRDGVPEVWPVGETILNLYEVKSVLGEGGMGTVYRCRHIGWNADLAVKSCKASMLERRGAIENFETEAETWVNLGLHPHIVSCYYVRRLGGLPRIFAEFVDGGSLKDWIDNGKLYEDGPDQSLERILDIAIQFAWGLHTAHEQGLVHQDVKPANVMLTSDGTAKVTDFGLAKARAMGGDGGRAAAGQSILVSAGGMTPAYCSPEQANGLPLTRKTDIWSWAVSVLEMFTGEVDWPSGSVAREALEGYLESGADDDRIPTMPTDVANLLRRCLDPRPEKRPANMSEVASGLMTAFQKTLDKPYVRPEPQRSRLLADGLNNQALSMCDLGKRQEAESRLERALESDPHHPEATYNLGLLKWRTGRMTPEALIAQLNEVAVTQGRDARSLHLLGLVHLEYGDSSAAIAALEEALRQSPDHQPTQLALHAARDGQSQWGGSRWTSKEFQIYIDATISPDGRTAFAINMIGKDRSVEVWDVQKGKLLKSWKSSHTEGLRRFSVSPKGGVAISASENGTLGLWDLAKERCVKTWHAAEKEITAVAFSPNGSHVLSASSYDASNGLKLWDVPGAACRLSWGPHATVRTIAWSPDGRFALSADTLLQLWDLRSAECVRQFETVHTAWVYQVAFSPDGKMAVSASYDFTLRIWNVSTGKCLRTLQGHTSYAQAVAITRNGKWIVSGSHDGTVRLWEFDTGKCVRTFRVKGEVSSVHILPDDRHVLCSGVGITVIELGVGPRQEFALCRPEAAESLTGQAKEALRLKEQAERALLAGNPAESYGLVTQALAMPGYSRATELLSLYDRVGRLGRISGFRAGWHARSLLDHTNCVGGVAVSPDGRHLVSTSWDSTARLWDLSDGRCLRVFADCMWGDMDGAVALSPDGQTLVVGCSNSNLMRVWQVRSGERVQNIACPNLESIRRIRVSPDCRRGLSFTYHGMPVGTSFEHRYRLRLWDLASGHCLWEHEQRDEIVSIAFSADSRRILVGGNRALWLLDASTGNKVGTFTGSQIVAWSVDFSSDGALAIAGGMATQGTASIEIWNLRTGALVRQLAGHTGRVTSIRFSPGGRHAASGGDDKTVRLWDLRNGTCLRVFEGHTAGIGCVDFSPDGQFLVSGSAAVNGKDFAIRVWRLVWDYEFPKAASWNDEARSFLESFLVLHTPYAIDLQPGTSPNKRALGQALQRVGQPQFTDAEVQQLLDRLAFSGFGWLTPDGVRCQLQTMAATWRGPPRLAALPRVSQAASQQNLPGRAPLPLTSSPHDKLAPPKSLVDLPGLSDQGKANAHLIEEMLKGNAAASTPAALVSAGNVQLGWLQFGLGILIMAIGVAWTCYLVRDGFRWSSLATAFLTVIGFGQTSLATERFGIGVRNLWIALALAIGFSAWTAYLVMLGRTYWCLATGAVAIFGVLGVFGELANRKVR